MNEWLLAHEPGIRLGCFLGVLLAMMVWEWQRPRRLPSLARAHRWPANLGLIAIDTVMLRLFFPLLAVGAAQVAANNGWGLFHWLEIPLTTAVIASLLVLDLAVYAQHVAFHKLTPLWRLHRTHHTDLDLDVTTALRFHPLEIMLSMLIKLALVTALGVPPVAVLLFEVLLNATAMFNHSNVYCSPKLDRLLRWLIVTPDMHRVHHSIHRTETDSNFGFNLPWWDRLFGTYQDQPQDGHPGMIIGLEYFRDWRAIRLDGLLLQPFLKPKP